MRLAWAAALLALSLALPEARAEPTLAGKAAADALYDQAKKLMASGDFEAACPKLAESQKIDPGVGTLLTLGECYDHTGRRASAWATFREAAALAATRGQGAREKIARKRVASLEPQLAKLIIVVPPAAQMKDLAVRRDEESIGKALWGTPLPLDTGEHTLAASAPGYKPWATKVRIATDGEVTTVSVPSLSLEEAAPAPVAPVVPVAKGGSISVRGAAGIGTIVLGLGGVGAGAGLSAIAVAKHNDAQAHCAPSCAAGGGDTIQADAKKLALGASIAFVAGGAITALGIVLVATAPSATAPRLSWGTPPDPRSAGLTVTPLLSPGALGAKLAGWF
jgi:serine/threonine-protein kinase